jgi:hypothetical protein
MDGLVVAEKAINIEELKEVRNVLGFHHQVAFIAFRALTVCVI